MSACAMPEKSGRPAGVRRAMTTARPVAPSQEGSPLRVLQILSTSDPGGVERTVCRLLPLLREKGIDGEVLLLRPGGEIERTLRERGIAVFRPSDLAPPIGRGGLPGLIRERGYRILHAYGLRASLWARIGAARTGAARIGAARSGAGGSSAADGATAGYDRPRPRVITAVTGVRPRHIRARALADRLTRRWNDLYVADCCASAEAAVSTLHIPASRTRIVPLGVDDPMVKRIRSRAEVRRCLGIDEEAPVVICVANIRPVKRHQDLLRAFGLLGAERRDARLLLVGEDRTGPETRRLADRELPAGSVLFLGSRSDVADLLAASDLFALASEAEGICVANMEAMLAGLPVVVTAVGGIPEVVRDGVDGELVPPRDPERLARTMLDLLRDRKRAGRLGRQARQRVLRNFSIERMSERLASLYREEAGRGEGVSRIRERKGDGR